MSETWSDTISIVTDDASQISLPDVFCVILKISILGNIKAIQKTKKKKIQLLAMANLFRNLLVRFPTVL
jgi:hypothetical protein